MFKEKPPLPSMSIIGMRPEIYCLDFFGKTRKECNEFNNNIKHNIKDISYYS